MFTVILPCVSKRVQSIIKLCFLELNVFSEYRYLYKIAMSCVAFSTFIAFYEILTSNILVTPLCVERPRLTGSDGREQIPDQRVEEIDKIVKDLEVTTQLLGNTVEATDRRLRDQLEENERRLQHQAGRDFEINVSLMFVCFGMK